MEKPDHYQLYIVDKYVYFVKKGHKWIFWYNWESEKSQFITFNQDMINSLNISPIDFFCVFGIIKIQKMKFLLIVNKASKVGQIVNKDIYKIQSVKFLTIDVK